MAQPFKRMVVGFNHNIKHQGQLYHVQTEDSGTDNPHVITHLFVGGSILASKKSSYAEFVGSEELEKHVRELMERQHKEMLKSLVNGAFDRSGNGVVASSPPVPVPAKTPVAANGGWPSPVQPVQPAAAQPFSREPITLPVRPPPASQPLSIPFAKPPAPPTLPRAFTPAAPPPSAPKPFAFTEGGVDSIFAEDPLNEKSLDEVILSYLAGETETK